MTKFTALLACGCIVFPQDGSQLERDIARCFDAPTDDPFASMVSGRCLLHGKQTFLLGIRNGSGAFMGCS